MIFIANALRRLWLGVGSKRPAHCVGGCVVDAVLCPVLKDERVSEKRDDLLRIYHVVAKPVVNSSFHLYPLAFLKKFVV